ncbi:MAG: type III polyketide synthase [Acidobacteria bacterium]|nr:type III polyketide synthase [Acidobacteriota bacterium]
MNPRILGLGTANPAERFTQEEVYALCGYSSKEIKRIFLRSDIDYRHLFIARNQDRHESPDQLHARFRQGALEIASQAIEKCLESAGRKPEDVDFVAAVTCTGYLCPGLASRLVRDLRMKRDVQRADIVGMGCAGALPGLQRAFDHVKAHSSHTALLVAVEICSAAYTIDDSNLETVVGNAICADGAAAVLLGPHGDGPEVLGFHSLLEPAFLEKVGFDFVEGKLRIVLGKEIPEVAGPMVQQALGELFGRFQVRKEDIRYWILHPGGRRVLDRIKEFLHLPEPALRHSRTVLRNYGNMSSPTVLFVLGETLRHERPQPGNLGLLMALGPGMAAESALLRF